jgi:hypothetical protein
MGSAWILQTCRRGRAHLVQAAGLKAGGHQQRIAAGDHAVSDWHREADLRIGSTPVILNGKNCCDFHSTWPVAPCCRSVKSSGKELQHDVMSLVQNRCKDQAMLLAACPAYVANKDAVLVHTGGAPSLGSAAGTAARCPASPSHTHRRRCPASPAACNESANSGMVTCRHHCSQVTEGHLLYVHSLRCCQHHGHLHIAGGQLPCSCQNEVRALQTISAPTLRHLTTRAVRPGKQQH